MKRMIAIAAVFCTLYGQLTWADPVPLPSNPGKARVVDTTGTLTQVELQQLRARSEALDLATGAVVLAVLVPTTGEETVAQYGLRLAEAWRPGHKGDERSVILVIAKADKKVRIETSRVMSTKLNDAAAGRIIKQMGDQALGKAAGSNFYKGIDIFYTEVAKYVPPKDVVAPLMTEAPTTVPLTDSYAWYLVVFALLGGAGTRIYLWWSSMRRAAQERAKREIREMEREEREEVERQTRARAAARYKQEEGRIKRTKPTNDSTVKAAAAGLAAATVLGEPKTSDYVRQSREQARLAAAEREREESAALARRREREESERQARRRRQQDDDDSIALGAAAAIIASRSSDDDSSSRSSRSSYDSGSSSSSSSSYDSGSSSSSSDGGGSSGGFD